MTMLEIHTEALTEVGSTYHEFLLRYKAHGKVVYGFVEGNDDPLFYRGLIEHFLPAGWCVELIKASGKKNLIAAYEYFDWTRFSLKRVCFFLDRDLSSFVEEKDLCGENVYVTDSYSIENEFADFGVFKRVLSEVLNIDDLTEGEWLGIKEKFDTGLAFFLENMVPVMAQIILWRRQGVSSCLDNIKLKNIFEIENGGLKVKGGLEGRMAKIEEIARLVKEKASKEDELESVEQEFLSNEGAKKFVRGKYVLWFFVELALDIYRSISNLVARLSKPPKISITIGAGNAMVFVAPRLRCPESLKEFIERTYCIFIRQIMTEACEK